MSAQPRINWFSPLPPTRSDIARQTLTLLPELATRAEVTVWCNDAVCDESAARHATIKRYDAANPPWRELNSADATFYQIGNDPRYHGDIWRVSRQHPGIVILHDLKLQHFFAGLMSHGNTVTADEYLDLVERHHSLRGRTSAESFLRGQISVDDLAEECSLIGAAIDRALGVLVHSQTAQTTLSETTSLPIGYLHLPAARPAPADESFIEARDWQSRPYRIVVFGFLGANRRLPSVMRALAEFPQRDQFRLDIYGTMEGIETVVQFACRLGLGEVVKWHGFATEDELGRALERSHLAINLRYPSMGEASGSQLHVWQYALPALATRIGWYETLPQDAAAFVRPDHEIEDIQFHLQQFLNEPERYREMGISGHHYVREHCITRSYADGILALVDRVPEFEALWIARDLAERAGTTMAPWTSSATDNASAGVAAAIAALVRGYFRPKQRAA